MTLNGDIEMKDTLVGKLPPNSKSLFANGDNAMVDDTTMNNIKSYRIMKCNTSSNSNGNNQDINGLRSSYSVYKENMVKGKERVTETTMDNDFQKRIDTLYPSSYRDHIRLEQQNMIKDIKNQFTWAIVVADSGAMEKAFRTLKSYLSLKYPLTKDDFEFFIITLFNMLYDKNYIANEHSIVTYLYILLVRGKKIIDIVIDWRPLYNKLRTSMNFVTVPPTMFNENDMANQKVGMYSLVVACRPFFATSAFQEIRDEVRPWICPHSNNLYVALYIMAGFLPSHHLSALNQVPDWVEEFFTIWETVENNLDWDERWLLLLNRIVKHSPNIPWHTNSIAKRFYTHFIRVIDLSIGNPKFSHLKPTKLAIPPCIKISREDNLEYTSMGHLISSLLTKQGDTMDLLKKLYSSIASYFHPSNQGDHTNSLLELLISTCHSFAKKHIQDPFNQEVVDQFIEYIFPHIVSTLYSKKKNNLLYTCKIVKELSYIAPNIILPQILDRLYGSVDKEEVNRIISELEVVSTCFHPLITQYPQGKSHVYNLMELAMNSMDPIYPNKSSAAFKFFNRIFSCVLLNDETIYMNTNQEEEEDEVLTKTTLSTSSFLDWSLLFLDSVLTFIKNASTKKEFHEHKRVTPPGVFLHETINLFFSQMSDEIYSAILEKLVHFFSKTFEPEYYKQYSAFLESSTIRNPSKSLATFLPLFIKKLFKVNTLSSSSDGGKYTIKDLSDAEYKYYISLMGYTVFKSGAALIEHRDTLFNICRVLLDSNNKVIIKQTSKLLRKAIYSLTRCYPSNNRSIPLELFEKNQNHIKYWGITDDTIYPIEWFQPTTQTIELAKQLISIFIKERAELLNQYLDVIDGNKTQFDRMKLFNYVKSIYSMMRTASHLMVDKNMIEIPKVDYKYPSIPMSPEHGRVIIEEFSTLQQRLYDIIHRLLEYVERDKNEEVQLLKIIGKALSSISHSIQDIQDSTNESLFTKWKNLKRYKTRNAIVFKSYKAHLLRQELAMSKLPLPHYVDKIVSDLSRLSVHRYKEVRKVAQTSLSRVIGQYQGVQSKVIPQFIGYLSAQRSDEEVKGSSHLLIKKNFLKKIKSNWKNTKLLSTAVMGPFDKKFKATTREHFVKLKQQFLLSKYEPTVIQHPSLEMKDIDNYDNNQLVPKQVLISQKQFIEKKNIENLNSLKSIVEMIIDQLKVHEKKDILTWKDLLFQQSFLVILISNFLKAITVQNETKQTLLNLILSSVTNDGNNNNGGSIGNGFAHILIQNISIIKDSIISIFRNMNSDYPISRLLSVNLISQILFIQDVRYREICFENYWHDASNQLYEKKLDTEQKDNIDIVILKSISNLILPSIETTFNDAFLEKLLKYITQDHDSEGQSHGVSVAISSKNVSLMWPNSRHPVSSSHFKIPYGKLFYNFQSWHPDIFFDRIKPKIELLKAKNDKEDQTVLSEMVGGLGRYITSGPDFSRREEVKSYIADILLNALNNCSNELNDAWMITIRFISYNTKFERLDWLIETLLKLYNNPLNIFSQAKSLRFLRALLYEITYKSEKFLDKLMDICVKEFSDPYKQVRDEASKLFNTVLSYQANYQNPEKTHLLRSVPPVLPAKSVQVIHNIIEESNNPNTPLDTRNNIKTNLVSLITHAFSRSNSNALIRLVPTLLPVVISYTSDSNQETAKAAMMCVASMAQGFYYDSEIQDQIIEQLKTITTSTYWRVRRSALPFIQILFFNHSLIFTPQQIESVIEIVLTFTKDSQIEVRELAKDTLASVLVSCKNDTNRIQNLIDISIKQLNNSKVNSENVLSKHQSILILSAVVLSSPYQIPPYFADVLDNLSRYSDSIPPLRDTVRTTLAEFWRTHKDTWEEEKLLFNEDQREMIRGTVAYPSYYA